MDLLALLDRLEREDLQDLLAQQESVAVLVLLDLLVLLEREVSLH